MIRKEEFMLKCDKCNQFIWFWQERTHVETIVSEVKNPVPQDFHVDCYKNVKREQRALKAREKRQKKSRVKAEGKQHEGDPEVEKLDSTTTQQRSPTDVGVSISTPSLSQETEGSDAPNKLQSS